MLEQIKIAIIGAGPAGITSAMQLKRFGFAPIIFEKATPGGLIHNANIVENYPGIGRRIRGVELAKKFKKILKYFKIKLIKQKVEKLEIKEGKFLISTLTNTYQSDIVIIASGTKPKELENVEISKEAKRRLFYHIYPKLISKRGKEIGIVGSGDIAFDYALNLSRNNDIFLFIKPPHTCLQSLFEATSRNRRINIFENKVITKITSEVNKLNLEMKDGSNFLLDYLLVAVGRLPNLDFLSKGLLSNVPLLEKEGRIYFVGDVIRGNLRQLSIAVGDGMLAAMKIYQLVKMNKISIP